MKLQPWKTQLLNPLDAVRENYQFIDDIYVCKDLLKPEDTVWRKSEFALRMLVPYTTTWCEQQLGEAILSRALSVAHLEPEDVVMDLGCGDGRYVRYFLSQGYRRIVALNYELEPLIALRERLTEDEKAKVLLIGADIMHHPLQESSADFVLAWSLFTSTMDFQASLRKCIHLMKANTYLFNAEPVLEHALTYALVMNDPDEFLRTLTTKTRPRMWSERESRYRVFTLEELSNLMADPLLERVETKGINVLPSLLFGGVLAGKTYDDDYKNALWQAIQKAETQWYRQMTYLSKKIGNPAP